MDYNRRGFQPAVKVLAMSGVAVAVFAGGVLFGRTTAGDAVSDARAARDVECERGDEALAATAAAQLAALVSRRVEGGQAVREAARRLGTGPEVAEEFAGWAEQENPVYRHALFGAAAVKVEARDGDRARVSVDGYWLRSADTAVGAGEVVSAMWTYWVVWRDGRWVPSSPPEAATLPAAAVHKASAFLRISSGYSAVPHVRC
ncbi:hypothetical protein ABZ816_35615 [Actinosynnema sp. NPDC047251]|uniref:Uncharacterized protein n=1 Tax=Saccharothrix espanaensis (strain ATCC 51144 / DSM 44229 / JCM 9112 / NBRC 15066 / NRRL 15764) TaxID=1179773 RepID=K0JTN9_SACES|nr:hypothetical protein [Saccharothrix espanaensis]CCH29301.1 hypothetical protein BN6_19810 [Saccharothrix espanaensis DSM 44229]